MTFNPTQPRETDGRFGSVHRGDPGQLDLSVSPGRIAVDGVDVTSVESVDAAVADDARVERLAAVWPRASVEQRREFVRCAVLAEAYYSRGAEFMDDVDSGRRDDLVGVPSDEARDVDEVDGVGVDWDRWAYLNGEHFDGRADALAAELGG